MSQQELEIPANRQTLIEVFMERNAKINLSAIRKADDIYQKHIQDALEVKAVDSPALFSLLDTSQKNAGKKTTACDLGTGGGFPLLPLAISYPHIQRTGLDARRKKIDTINAMASDLQLQNCIAVHGRAEEHSIKYDLVTARAVAYIDKLFPWLDHLLKHGGIAVLYKKYSRTEDMLLKSLIKKNDWKLLCEHSYDDGRKVMYVLEK